MKKDYQKGRLKMVLGFLPDITFSGKKTIIQFFKNKNNPEVSGRYASFRFKQDAKKSNYYACIIGVALYESFGKGPAPFVMFLIGFVIFLYSGITKAISFLFGN